MLTLVDWPIVVMLLSCVQVPLLVGSVMAVPEDDVCRVNVRISCNIKAMAAVVLKVMEMTVDPSDSNS